MSRTEFFLRPFTGASIPGRLEITGSIGRLESLLRFEAFLSGEISWLDIPPPAAAASRRKGLWEETCFELFLAHKGLPGYWEFNMSPSGQWNVFRFSGYRKEMQEEFSFASLPFTVAREPGRLSIRMEVQLDRLFDPSHTLEAAVSMVVKDNQGQISYWALTHPGPRPDFHGRESFLIDL